MENIAKGFGVITEFRQRQLLSLYSTLCLFSNHRLLICSSVLPSSLSAAITCCCAVLFVGCKDWQKPDFFLLFFFQLSTCIVGVGTGYFYIQFSSKSCRKLVFTWAGFKEILNFILNPHGPHLLSVPASCLPVLLRI